MVDALLVRHFVFAQFSFAALVKYCIGSNPRGFSVNCYVLQGFHITFTVKNQCVFCSATTSEFCSALAWQVLYLEAKLGLNEMVRVVDESLFQQHSFVNSTL